MKLISLFILCYLYLNQVNLSSAVPVEDRNNENAEISDQRPTGMDDLSFELQLMILENLSLIELLHMSSTNAYYRELSADVFRRKIGVKKIIFSRRNYIEAEEFEITSMNVNEKSIYVENYDVMLTILKSFGHLLTNLHMDFGSAYDIDQRKLIVQYISRYCSEGLQHLELEYYPRFSLNYFSLPFKRVENLSISFTDVFAGNWTLDAKFPALRQLKLKNVYLEEKSLSGGEFSYLKQISFGKNPKNGLQSLISKSPHLKSLQVESCPYELLKFVNENCPKLVELKLLGTTFNNVSYYNDMEYRFKNVKKLYIQTNCNPPKHFTFDQLDEIEIDGFFGFGSEWLNFTVQNTNLTRFGFLEGLLDDSQLGTIADNLKNLKNVTIKCSSSVQSETIARLVHNNHKLKRLKMIVSRSAGESIKQILRNEWNLIEEGEHRWDTALYFEKN